MKYLKKSDIFVTLIILLLDSILVFLFFASIYASGNYGTTDRIGTLIFKKRVATRKHIDALSWNILQNDTPVYELDTIRTASQSEASIEFDDGSSIDLLENTLIKLKTKNAQELGDFVHGSLVFSSKGSKKSVTVAGRLITMNEDSEIVIHKGEDGENEVEIIQGSVEVQEDDGSVVTVQQQQSITVPQEEGARLDIRKVSCLPLSPSPNKKLLTSKDSSNLRFLWAFSSEDMGSTPSNLIIATDKNCENVIAKVLGTASLDSPSIYHANYTANVGSFYWRVEYENGKLSSTRRLSLNKITQIEPIKPYKNEEFYYYEDIPSILFSWNASIDSGGSYILEVSENEDFTNPRIKTQASATSIEVNNFSEGRYYWRVLHNTKQNVLGELPSPIVRSFDVVRKEVLQDVKMKFPIDGYLCNINVFATSGLSFTWDSMSEAQEYELFLYNRKEDEVPSETFNCERPYLKLTKNTSRLFDDEGNLYFSVRYKSRHGNYSTLSSKRLIKKVNYDVDFKSLYPPDGYAISHSLIMGQRFSWKHNLPLKTFFVVSKDKNFKDVVLEKEVSSLGITGLNLKPESYYWQVRAYNTDKSIFAKTETKSFSVVNPLNAPAVLYPNDKALVSVMEDKGIELRWQEVPGADYYALTLYNGAGNRVFYNGELKSTRFLLPASTYREDKYQVELQAFRFDSPVSTRNVGYKSSSSFTSKVLTYVKLVEPQANKRFDGIKSYQDGLKFSYNTKEKYDVLGLVLKKNGHIIKTPYRHDKAKRIIEVSSVASGEYEWSISAFIAGHDISSRERRRFTILPIPPLPAPVFIKNKMVKTIGVEYLMNNRSIHFEWKAVKDASYYVLQLENLDTGQIVKTVSDLKNTFYDFSEIEKLNIGKFNFKVRAVSILGAGNVRGGYEGEYPFEIALPKLEDLEVKDEEYYGY